MTWDKLITATPINRQSATVTSQRGIRCSDRLSRCELKVILASLRQEQATIKKKLGIETTTQHRNLITKLRNGKRTRFSYLCPDVVKRYLSLSDQICRIELEIAELRRPRK